MIKLFLAFKALSLYKPFGVPSALWLLASSPFRKPKRYWSKYVSIHLHFLDQCLIRFFSTTCLLKTRFQNEVSMTLKPRQKI